MNYKNKFQNYLSIALIVLALSSCQKVINVDLNSAAPAIIIEGNISNQVGSNTVTLSKTVNFSDANVFPAVTGASVTINDNAGNSEILAEVSSGVYKTSTLQGIIGRAYTISVTANGKNYQAVSAMAAPVAIDTLIEKTSTGFGGGPNGGTMNKSVEVQFTDPTGTANYYRLVELVNGVLINNITITSDNLRDGSVIAQGLREGADIKLQIGDIITVQLQNIDKNVYEYFRTFNDASGGGNFNSSTPANPTSNLNNGALGYFSAYAVTSKTIVIQ
jgi:hypothetical protein